MRVPVQCSLDIDLSGSNDLLDSHRGEFNFWNTFHTVQEVLLSTGPLKATIRSQPDWGALCGTVTVKDYGD